MMTVLTIMGIVLGAIGAGWAVHRWLIPLFRREQTAEQRLTRVEQKLDRVLEYLDGLPTTPNPARRGLFEKARGLEAKSQFQEAIPLFRQLLAHPASPSEELALLILIGNCFSNLSQLEEAQGHYTEALEKAKKLKNNEAEATALGNLGFFHMVKGDLDKALTYYQNVLEIDEKIGNRRMQGSDLISMGIIYSDKGEVDKAKDHFSEASKISKELADLMGKAISLRHLGLDYMKRGQLDEALECFEIARSFLEICGEELDIKVVKRNIAHAQKLKAGKK